MGVEYGTFLGRSAYEAYHKSAGGKSPITGADLPSYWVCPEEVRKAWVAAAMKVASLVAMIEMELMEGFDEVT